MNKAFEEIMDNITSIIVALLCITFIVTLLNNGDKYNKIAVDSNSQKASIIHSLSYGTENLYMTPDNVYTDILQENANITTQINGNSLNADTLEKAKNHNIYALAGLKNVIGNTRYKKVLVYDINNVLIRINYVGE